MHHIPLAETQLFCVSLDKALSYRFVWALWKVSWEKVLRPTFPFFKLRRCGCGEGGGGRGGGWEVVVMVEVWLW